jgi:hypothetical protein
MNTRTVYLVGLIFLLVKGAVVAILVRLKMRERVEGQIVKRRLSELRAWEQYRLILRLRLINGSQIVEDHHA